MTTNNSTNWRMELPLLIKYIVLLSAATPISIWNYYSWSLSILSGWHTWCSVFDYHLKEIRGSKTFISWWQPSNIDLEIRHPDSVGVSFEGEFSKVCEFQSSYGLLWMAQGWWIDEPKYLMNFKTMTTAAASVSTSFCSSIKCGPLCFLKPSEGDTSYS